MTNKLNKKQEERFDKVLTDCFSLEMPKLKQFTWKAKERRLKQHLADELVLEGKKRYKEAERTTTTVLNASHKAELARERKRIVEELEKKLPREFSKFDRDKSGYHWSSDRRMGYNQYRWEVKNLIKGMVSGKPFNDFKLHSQKQNKAIKTINERK